MTTTDENEIGREIDKHQIERLTELVARQGQRLGELAALVDSQQRLLNGLADGRMGMLAHRADVLEAATQGLAGRVGDLEASHGDLQGSITPLYAAVERLEKQANPLRTLDPKPAEPFPDLLEREAAAFVQRLRALFPSQDAAGPRPPYDSAKVWLPD